MLQLTIVGHIGQNATINDVNGKKAINFTVAHSENFTNKQGVKETKTTWIKCVLWKNSNDPAAIAPFLKQGTQVLLQGKPEVESYVNKEQKTVAVLKITVATIQLLSAKNSSQPTQPTQPNQPVANNTGSVPQNTVPENNGYAEYTEFSATDDLPF